MGAKFIDDVDNIASNERCLKLCCETNDCDVFIFEEKVSNKREHEKSCLMASIWWKHLQISHRLKSKGLCSLAMNQSGFQMISSPVQQTL